MKIGFFTEGGYEGKVPRNHPNMRTDLAWICSLDATHHPWPKLQSLDDNLYDLRYFLEIFFLIIICYLFSVFLKRLKIPSPILVGAMALSGVFYTFEIVNSRFPDIVINIAFIFLGTALGSRLNGLKLKELIFFIFHGIIVSSILVIVAMITAYLLQYIGFDFIPTFLSFAPGGIHEMVVISVAYNIDPIFVSYHHFLRILIIVAFLPFLLKKFSNK